MKKIILKNGLTIITVPMKGSMSATALVMVRAGSKYETKEQNGLSHFLEHMCFKGTEKRPTAGNISREIDGLGAQNNAFTSQEFTGYYAKSHPKHINKILDIVSDIYLNPIFDEKEIEKEKGVIIEEINMYEDMPHRSVHDVFMSAMYGDQPAGWGIAGTKEVVKKISRKDFIEYRKKHYVAEATTVIISGDIDQKKIVDEVKRAFKNIPTGKKTGKKKVIEKQVDPTIEIKSKKTDQTHIVIGVRTYKAEDKKNYALRVLNGVLGAGMSSRLFQKLRDEMGVGYYVRSGIDEYTDHGYLAVSTGVDKTRVEEVVKAVLVEMKRMATTIVPDEELRKVKDYIAGNMYMGLESSDAVAEYYAMQDMLTSELLSPSEFTDKLEKVSAKDVMTIAKEIMKDNKLVMALVGDLDSNQKNRLKKIFRLDGLQV